MSLAASQLSRNHLRRPDRRVLPFAIALALVPGVLFVLGVMCVGLWGVTLWPHQLYFWLLGASILGPLLAAAVMRQVPWSLGFITLFFAALVTGGMFQIGVSHDIWTSCPTSQNPRAWEMRPGESSTARAEATCVYFDPNTGHEVDRTSFTMFDRIKDMHLQLPN